MEQAKPEGGKCNDGVVGEGTAVPANNGQRPVSRTVNSPESGKEAAWTSHELQQAQEKDPDIGPIITLMRNSTEKPVWSNIAPERVATKAYWAQWETL